MRGIQVPEDNSGDLHKYMERSEGMTRGERKGSQRDNFRFNKMASEKILGDEDAK